MQDNAEQPPSLSQLMRESYLAEARAQQRHSEVSRSDASSSRLQIYGSLKGKAEDAGGHGDVQLPDLSAFLSQEELDKSVNLARQAIGHEERAEVKASVAPLTPSSVSPGWVSSSEPPSVPLVNPSPAPLAAPSTAAFTQLEPEYKELPATQTAFTSDRKVHKASARQENRNGRDEGFNDFNRSARTAPYGLETQSKKEFLNKAADFIEELSSLFKANSSKRVRPRACKTHRSRNQNKSQNDGTVDPYSVDSRERNVLAVEEEPERASPVASQQPQVEQEPGPRPADLQDYRITEEQQYSPVSQEVEAEEEAEVEAEEAESCALTDTPYSSDPVCEPPHFVQKLKSREVQEGSKVQLDCIVRGLPAPEVRWFCEGKELENSPDIQIITDGEHHSLIIAEAFEEDTGRYSCFASNFYGTDSTSAEIYVEGASSSDSEAEQHFELQRKSLAPASVQTLSVGEDNSPSSQPAAAPEEPAEQLSPPTTSQTISEAPLPVYTSTIAPPAPPALATVSTVSTAEPAQEETTVVAVQLFPTSSETELPAAQEVLTSASVISVQPAAPLTSVVMPILTAPEQIPRPETQTSKQSYLPGLNGQPIMAAPVFTKSLQDLLASESQLVVLECRVKGAPSPQVVWYREGKIITDSPDFRILQKKPRSPAESEEICTLVIAEVFPEDSGMFTCTASNKYGTVSSSATLKVKGNGNNNHARSFTSLMVEPSPIQEAVPSAPTVNPQPEVTVTNSIKPHSSTIRLDPLIPSSVRLDPLNTSTLRLDPFSSSMLRPDHLRSSLPSLEPSSLNSGPSLTSLSTSTPNLDPISLHQGPAGPGGLHLEPQTLSYPRPYVSPSEQKLSRPSVTSPSISSEAKKTSNHQSESPVVVPLPDPPPNSCLKTGSLTNHRDSRSSNRVGLRVHFKLPEDEYEDERSEASSQSDEDSAQMSVNKEPPPVRAKPKLDPAQLQLLHNQVLMEQQQETEPQSQTHIQPEVQSPHEGPLWSPRMQREPHQPLLQPHPNTTTPLQQAPSSAAALVSALPAPSLSSGPAFRATLSSGPSLNTALSSGPSFSSTQSSGPSFSSTQSSGPSLNTTLSSGPALRTTLSSGPSLNSIQSSGPSLNTTLSSGPALRTTLSSGPSLNTTLSSGPSLNTTLSSGPALNTTLRSGPALSTTPSSGPSLNTTLSSGPSLNTTLSSGPSLNTTLSSGPSLNTTLSSGPSLNTTLRSAPSLSTTLSSGPALSTILSPLVTTSPAPALSSPPSVPQLKTSTLMTSPPPAPQLTTAPPLTKAPVTQMNTIHASHLNLSPAALARTTPAPSFFSPPAPRFSTAPTDSAPDLQITSPTALLRSTHASLMNLTATSQTFNYARPKEFIAAHTFSPVRSPSPIESPVPLLQELAAELNSSAASSPTLPPFSPPSRILPTRVLTSPTSPPLLSSPTPGSAPFLNSSMFAVRAQSPPQASSPTSSSSTPSPIQNPVAFLSSVLPSLSPSQPTNSMGLPRGAPLGLKKSGSKARPPSIIDIRESKEILLQDIEKKLRFKDDTLQFSYQQKLSIEGKTASRPLGPNIPATVINYDEEYKVSSFEQRLMSEIEFRLERTPVEESDDEVQHDDVPTGKCIAPIFDKKLKNFRAMEGVPVTFSCKIVGVPVPKVYWFKDGKQILRKNVHYKKIREGDGTCALHISSTTNDDDGNYTVMAANPQGRISCSGHLIVQTGPPRPRMTPIHSQRVRTRIQEVESEQTQERFFRPHFLQAPGDMLAHEGRLCRLDCKVSGLPNPELMWLANGKPIYSDQYHKMLVRENGIHSLVIDPLKQDDAGTYTCIASNKAGQSSFSLELKVVEKEMKHPPQFLEKLQNMGIPEGTPVRLECRVVGMPPPAIYWKKDNDTIAKTKDRISVTQDATGYVCLLIQPTVKDDAGWYTVSAKNEAGIVSCTCRLDIYAQWHQSVPAPMKKTQRTGSRYAALTGQGLDIRSAFPTSETSPILFSSSPPEATLESEEL